jgi:uncharacterized protein YbjT (DUF2867 family)
MGVGALRRSPIPPLAKTSRLPRRIFVKVLVTGATGNVGRLVVDQLLDAGVEVRALTNNPSKAALPTGVEVVEGYLGKLATMPAALEGVQRLYLAPLPRTAQTVVDMAVHAGVERIVALSSSGADDEAQGDPSAWWFYAVERAAESAPGIEWTHLRPGEFMLNALGWADSIRAEGVVRAAYGAASYAPLDLVDIAAIAAKVLLEDGHHGAKYEMTGPESLSKIEKVRIIGEVLGREIRFVEISHAEARAEMVALGYGEATDWLLDGDAQMIGHPQPVLPTVPDLLGRPSKTFAAWVRDHVDAFR